MSDLVRSSVLTGFRSLVTQLSGDPIGLLRRSKIAPEALERHDALISFRAVVRLLERSAEALNCPDFGLQMAQQQDLRILGPVAIIGLNSPTVQAALQAMIEHIAFYSPVVLSTIEIINPDRVLLTYDIALEGEPHRRQVVELALGLYCRHMQTLTQNHFVPTSILFRHTSPMAAAVYRRHFGVRVHFGQPINAVVVRMSDLQRPIDNTDPHLRQVIADYVRLSIASHPLDIERQVAFLVRKLLPSARCSLKVIARHLYLHERTLQRRLTAAGIVFEQIVDQTRRERAEELLSESHLSMGRIAEQLGYNEQSSFNRAVRRWFGAPPKSLKDYRPNSRR